MQTEFEAFRNSIREPRVRQILLSMLDEPYALAGAAHVVTEAGKDPLEALEKLAAASQAYEDRFNPADTVLPEDFVLMTDEDAGLVLGQSALARECLEEEGLKCDTVTLKSLCCKGIRISPPPKLILQSARRSCLPSGSK